MLPGYVVSMGNALNHTTIMGIFLFPRAQTNKQKKNFFNLIWQELPKLRQSLVY